MQPNRRHLLLGGLASAASLALAGGPLADTAGAGLSPEEQRRLHRALVNKRIEIDRQIDSVINYMLDTYPQTEDYIVRSVGMLVIPTITKVGLFLGGSGGEGALRVANETVGYYSAAQVSFGLQLGAGQFSHILFFMTEAALQRFQTSKGWALGAEVEVAMLTQSDFAGGSTISRTAEVIGLNLGGQGAILGASIKGIKYTRLEDIS